MQQAPYVTSPMIMQWSTPENEAEENEVGRFLKKWHLRFQKLPMIMQWPTPENEAEGRSIFEEMAPKIPESPHDHAVVHA